jgi:hypothetical protein
MVVGLTIEKRIATFSQYLSHKKWIHFSIIFLLPWWWAFYSEKALASVLFIEIFHCWVIWDVGVDSCLISYLQYKTKQTNKQTNKQKFRHLYRLFLIRTKLGQNLKFVGSQNSKVFI